MDPQKKALKKQIRQLAREAGMVSPKVRVRKNVNPRPFPTGNYVSSDPLTSPASGWGRADRFVSDVNSRGDLPSMTTSSDQRECLLEIVRLRGELEKATSPAVRESVAAALTHQQLRAHALGVGDLAKSGNAGSVTNADMHDRMGGAGDLAALHAAMGAGNVAPKFKGKAKKLPKPSSQGVDWGDDAEEVESRIAALKEALDARGPTAAIRADQASQDATLAALRAFHRSAGAPSVVAAIEQQRSSGRSAVKALDNEIARLTGRLNTLTDQLEKSGEATTRADLDQERRNVAAQLTLARLRAAHQRLEI